MAATNVVLLYVGDGIDEEPFKSQSTVWQRGEKNEAGLDFKGLVTTAMMVVVQVVRASLRCQRAKRWLP